MGLHNYLIFVRKLNNMGRWATEFMHQRTTVSEHSFSVAQVGQMLGIIEEQNGAVLDWGILMKKLLNHDMIESITGDILSTTKHKKPEVTEAILVLERELGEEKLFSYMEEPYKHIYRDLLFDGKDESLEGQILQYADNIDALMECICEVQLGNCHPFEEKYWVILGKLKNSPLISVEYFLQKILPELVADCEKLTSTP